MIRLERDAGAAALIWALEDAATAPNEDPQTVRSQLRIDRAMVALLRVHVADAIVPELLRDPAVWNPTSRDGITIHVDGGRQTIMTGHAYLSLWDTTHAVRKLAEEEGAPAISEWHVIRRLIESREQDLTSMQIRTAVLLHGLEVALDIRAATSAELTRAWCFCDTSFFLESKLSFWDVDWGTALGFGKRVVLIVPPAIMDELDLWRSSDKQRFGRERKRARSVVRRMDKETDGHAYGEPVRVTDEVQLVRFGWEPRKTQPGLTNTLADDRLVSSALEYRWRRPGLDVQLLTADRGPYEKARRLGLPAVYLPAELRRDGTEKDDEEQAAEAGSQV